MKLNTSSIAGIISIIALKPIIKIIGYSGSNAKH